MGKAFEFLDGAVFGSCQPSIQIPIPMLGQHADKLLGQGISTVEIAVSRTDLLHLLLLFLVKLGLLTDVQKGGLVQVTGDV